MTYLEYLVFIAWVDALPRSASIEFTQTLSHAQAWIVLTISNDRLRDRFVKKMDAVVLESGLWN